MNKILNNMTAIPRHYTYNAWWSGAKIIASYIALVAVMWVFNILGGQAINLLMMILMPLAFWLLVWSPKGITLAMAYGLAVGELKDQDLSQSILSEGLRSLLRLSITVTYHHMIVAGVLATWWFGRNPIAFWYIFAFGGLILFAGLYHNSSGKWLFYIVMLWSVAVCAAMFWSTLDSKEMPKWFTSEAEVASPIPAAELRGTRVTMQVNNMEPTEEYYIRFHLGVCPKGNLQSKTSEMTELRIEEDDDDRFVQVYAYNKKTRLIIMDENGMVWDGDPSRRYNPKQYRLFYCLPKIPKDDSFDGHVKFKQATTKKLTFGPKR